MKLANKCFNTIRPVHFSYRDLHELLRLNAPFSNDYLMLIIGTTGWSTECCVQHTMCVLTTHVHIMS